MGEPATSDSPSDPEGRSAGHTGPDRRNTIDLLRVERGEIERRRLPRPRLGSSLDEIADDPGSADETS